MTQHHPPGIMYRPPFQRLRWGVGWGLAFATIFSLWLLVPVLAGWPSRFVQAGVTPLSVVALYVLAGLIGGTIVGLAAPLATSARGAALVGALTALPAYLGAGVLVFDDSVPTSTYFAGMLLVALFVGSAAGAIYHQIFRSDIQQAMRRQHRHMRKEATKAFKLGQFAEVIELLEHAPGTLTANDRRRLAAARAQLTEGNAT